MTTTLNVNQKTRTVEFTDREGFILGETYDPAIISGVSGCDLTSLCIYFYDPVSGTLLSGAFNDPLVPESQEITKQLDRFSCSFNFLSSDCVNLFAGSQEDKDIVVVVRDANLVYCKALVPLKYVPNVTAGDPPDIPTLVAAFAAHNLDPDAHPPLVACSQIPDLRLNAADDNLTFAQLVTNFNALVLALRTPRS